MRSPSVGVVGREVGQLEVDRATVTGYFQVQRAELVRRVRVIQVKLVGACLLEHQGAWLISLYGEVVCLHCAGIEEHN